MMEIATGVMVMKDGKAWGVEYSDGQCTSYGWIDPERAPIHDPKYCRVVTDVTYKGSPYTAELLTGKLVHVERRTEVIVKDSDTQDKEDAMTITSLTEAQLKAIRSTLEMELYPSSGSVESAEVADLVDRLLRTTEPTEPVAESHKER